MNEKKETQTLIAKNKMEITINGETYTFKPGDTLIFDSWGDLVIDGKAIRVETTGRRFYGKLKKGKKKI